MELEKQMELVYKTCLWYQTLKNGVNELKKAVAETCRSFLCIMDSLELLI